MEEAILISALDQANHTEAFKHYLFFKKQNEHVTIAFYLEDFKSRLKRLPLPSVALIPRRLFQGRNRGPGYRLEISVTCLFQSPQRA